MIRSPRSALALGMLATLAMVAGTWVSDDSAPLTDDAVWGMLALLAPGLCSVLAWWWPRACVVVAPVVSVLCFATVTSAFPLAFCLAVPLYAAGRLGHLRWGAASIAGTVLLTGFYRLFLEGVDDRLAVVLEELRDTGLLVAVLLLGDLVLSRVALSHEARLQADIREAEHQRRLVDQRLATARELHDVLAHTLTLVSIQASVAAECHERDPSRTQAAIARLRTATAEAMADLRGTIALLRRPAATSHAPVPGLDDIAELVARARASGLRVTHTGSHVVVRPAIGLAGYRIVQEALTNTLRHAHATHAEVSVEPTADGVTVSVRDDGTALPAGAPGFGLNGMAERVSALGGSLHHGPRSDRSGFEVVASLPSGSP